MPKVTEAHLEARRQQILAAAAACFARKGFHQCTMHDICAEAELSPGAVYRYFSSKEEIIAAMSEDLRRRNAALIDAVKGLGNTLAVLDELSDFYFGMLEENQEACALDIELWAEALRNPTVAEVQRRLAASLHNKLAEIVRTAQERGEVNGTLNADAVAQVMVSFFHGLIVQKGLDPDVDVRKYVAAMKAMMKGTFWTGERQEGS